MNFSATLIENKKYYRALRMIGYGLCIYALMLVLDFFDLQVSVVTWVGALVIGIYIAAIALVLAGIYLRWKSRSDKAILINSESIVILNKSNKAIRRHKREDVQSIEIHAHSASLRGILSALWLSIVQGYARNYVTLNDSTGEYHYEFDIASLGMRRNLDKLKSEWSNTQLKAQSAVS